MATGLDAHTHIHTHTDVDVRDSDVRVQVSVALPRRLWPAGTYLAKVDLRTNETGFGLSLVSRLQHVRIEPPAAPFFIRKRGGNANSRKMKIGTNRQQLRGRLSSC